MSKMTEADHWRLLLERQQRERNSLTNGSTYYEIQARLAVLGPLQEQEQRRFWMSEAQLRREPEGRPEVDALKQLQDETRRGRYPGSRANPIDVEPVEIELEP